MTHKRRGPETPKPANPLGKLAWKVVDRAGFEPAYACTGRFTVCEPKLPETDLTFLNLYD